MNPQFPIYIPSKGRWERRITARALEAMNVPFLMIVEEAEFKNYAAVIDPKKLLVLDPAYQKNYDPFWKDGEGLGPGPARNFAWEHSLANGHAWHWVVDDNIYVFQRLNRNKKVTCADGTIFRCMEDFCLRYRNVAMAGPHYHHFVHRKFQHVPIILNSRIYSCNLIRNDVAFRWRGRYNEDSDLSLRMLKAGWCTVLFKTFLQAKAHTGGRGGNTDEFYAREGTLNKSRMLVAMHPDVCKLKFRFGRWHHVVNYAGFKKNKLIRDPSAAVSSGVNDYGMELVKEKPRRSRAGQVDNFW